MFYILPSIHTILVKSFLSHSFFLRRTLFFYTLVQTLYDICNSTLSAIDCERHLNPLSSSLFVNAVGRPHHNSKVWRIFGQTHSVHGTPRQMGFSNTTKCPGDISRGALFHCHVILLYQIVREYPYLYEVGSGMNRTPICNNTSLSARFKPAPP